MKMKHTVPAVAMIGAATLALAACSQTAGGADAAPTGGSEGEAMTLVLGHAGSTTDPRQLASEQLKEILETETDGRITVEIHPNSTLGSWEQMIEGLELGTTDIVIESILALESYTDLASVETAPFLYEDADHFFKVWDGELGAEIKSSITEASGFELLGNMFRGARNLTANTPVTKLSDLEGLTLRTPSAATMVETWQTLGARAEAMAWDEVYSALEQGVIDGQENPFGNIAKWSWDEVQKYISLSKHVYTPVTLVMNLDRYESLTDEQKEAVHKAAREAVESSRQYGADADANLEAVIRERSPDVEFNDIDSASFQPVAKEISAEIGKIAGEDFTAKFVDAATTPTN